MHCPNNEIHVFVISIKNHVKKLSQYFALLDTTERERAYHFRFKKDQERFVIAHGMLRRLLSSYLEKLPHKITFSVNAYGKPKISNITAPLCFNMSHSSDYVLIGVSTTPLGVDIEYINENFDRNDMVAHCFSESKQRAYQTLTPKEKRIAFYRIWTQKEAYLKAIGKGLHHSLKTFSVEISPHKPAAIYGVKDGWHIHSFMPHDQYCAAIAWQGQTKKIVVEKI